MNRHGLRTQGGIGNPDGPFRNPMTRHRTLIRLSAALAGVALVWACGGDSPTAPPTPEPARPTTVTVSPATAELTALGATVQLIAEVRDQDARVIAGVTVTWSSGDPSVATTDESGLVTGVGEGEATITASTRSVSGSAVVMVTQPVASVEVSPSADTIGLGSTLELTAKGFDENGDVVEGAEFSWESSDAAIATVDASGFVRGVALGMATITASAGSGQGTAEITVMDLERAALVALYEATDGPNWVNSENWLTDAPLGEWFGVDTGASGRVVSLVVAGRRVDDEYVSPGLTGSIPPELGDLTELVRLRIEGNTSLTGSIPRELGNLSNLTQLRLGWNNLTGPMPAELGNLTNLEDLYLYGNDLTGPIPPELGNLTNLKRLNLGESRLVGSIPSELGRLTNLTRLYLALNNLTGPIPPELGNLTNLTVLALSRNSLTGSIPPELGNLTRLESLSSSLNNLTGPIPPELGNLANLTGLVLSRNDLTGTIPESFLEVNGLEWFRFDNNAGLCVPGATGFVTWLERIENVFGPYCNESDMKVLDRLYQTSGGSDWTNSSGWLETPVLDEWYGVTANALGRVVTLDLTSNGLTGDLPASVGKLAEMTALRVDSNALSGRLPSTLAQLPLQEFHYADTGLCVPALSSFQTWLNGIASHEGTGMECDLQSDREILVALYESTDGPNWTRSDNWLTDAPLGDWYGVATDASGRVVYLYLYRNNLAGPIPPELGNLASVTTLNLGYNLLNGPIPPEFGNLDSLESVELWQNNLTGPIPAELGTLANLEGLFLNRNNLAGAIPAELGKLGNLEDLYLNENRLTGPVPGELGDLSNVEYLFLDNNDLSGLLPPAFGKMSSLKWLGLTNNSRMQGPLPHELTALRQLEAILAGATQLCAPSDPGFQAWLAGVHSRRIVACASGVPAMAYLTQAVQSLEYPVPLVAGEKALLRVFVTAAHATEAGMPPVRARFYVNGTETHVAEIADKTTPIPTEVVESDLSSSANVEIPGEIVHPGLEMVIEIDPGGTLDSDLGVARRLPATGRMSVDVRAMPLVDLTIIPFVQTQVQDSSVVDLIDAMAADSENHELLEETRTLLPVEGLKVAAHEPVLSSISRLFTVLAQTEAIQAMEGGTGHYMGMMLYPGGGPAGVAKVFGRASAAIPDGLVMAHELGHNMSLAHAPCGTFGDPSFPYLDGSIGAWGYDFRDGGRLVRPSTPDLMSYCRPKWISDYSFTNALRYRLFDEGTAAVATAASTQSLFLWGGVDADSIPFLEPVFVVDAPALLPDSAGSHWITGRTASGAELFSLGFTMPETADGDGSSSFAFVLPVQPGWQDRLANITLLGPGGSVTLDSDTDIPMSILVDPSTRQVRGILRDLPQADAPAALAPQADPDSLDVLFSRGIPDAAAWGR